MKPPNTLYELSAELLELQYELESFDGDVSDSETEQKIDALLARAEETGDQVNKKLDGYVAIMEEVESRAERRMRESKRLSELAKKDQNKAAWLMSRLFSFFSVQKIKSRETELHTFTLANAGGLQAMQVDEGLDLDLIEDKFLTEVPEQVIQAHKVINNEALRAYLSTEGNELSYARLLPRKQKLNIK